MADEFAEEGRGAGGSKKMPKWIWLAVGGGALLLVMLKGGSGSKNTMATDNLLAAELDAELKSIKEAQDLQAEQYKADQKVAWEDFKLSIEDLLRERQGNTAPPSSMNQYPVSGNSSHPNQTPINPPAPPTPPLDMGNESPGLIPDAITGSVYDNFIMGFNYHKAKVG